MRQDIDREFGRTMMWVVLCMLAILAIAYISHWMHTPQVEGDEAQEQPFNVRDARQQLQDLNTLEDSIHEFEDGF